MKKIFFLVVAVGLLLTLTACRAPVTAESQLWFQPTLIQGVGSYKITINHEDHLLEIIEAPLIMNDGSTRIYHEAYYDGKLFCQAWAPGETQSQAWWDRTIMPGFRCSLEPGSNILEIKGDWIIEIN